MDRLAVMLRHPITAERACATLRAMSTSEESTPTETDETPAESTEAPAEATEAEPEAE